MGSPEKPLATATVDEPSQVISPAEEQHPANDENGKRPPPLLAKLAAVFLISCISFGSAWSSGVTGAMKSTIKKQMHISNTQFSLLEASEDFMVTLLMLGNGIVTDRVGGAEMIVYGNIVYTIGSILVAAATTVRSFNFMVGGRIILALGDIATQVAQYKMFSSWFSPSNGFASTLGLELAMRKIGGFVGKSTANPIAKNTGNFAWVYWTSVFMNLFTNGATVFFWMFNRYCNRHYEGRQDKATREVLTEKNKKFEIKKVFQLPWMFWSILGFSMFQTSAAMVFSQNATELAEKRFNVDAIKAGWYSSLSQYAGFFLVPCLGVFIDVLGNRATILFICGTGMLLCMTLVNFASSKAGTGAAFGIYAIASALGPTTIIDGIRTSLWHQSVFGSAYAIKVTMNNAMNIIIRIITGALQDADNDSYHRAVRVYLFLAASSMLCDELGLLQWTRKRRLTYGPEIIDNMRQHSLVTHERRSWWISVCCFSALILLLTRGYTAVYKMMLPSELILNVVESLIPPNPPVAYPRSHSITQTLLSLSLVSKLTSKTAKELLYKHCLYIDSEHCILSLMQQQNGNIHPSGIFLAPFSEGDLNQPEVVNRINQLSYRAFESLTKLVINMPLRSLYPEEDENQLRPVLRAAFSRLTNLEEFCSVQDELYLGTVEDDSEPAVWSFWPRLRRLALYNADVTDPQLFQGLRRCPSIRDLVLVRADGLIETVSDEEVDLDAYLQLKAMTIVNTKEFYRMMQKDDLRMSFCKTLESRSENHGRVESADVASVGPSLRIRTVCVDKPEDRKDEDIAVCQEWLLQQAMSGELWHEHEAYVSS
ncbi:MFS general substrate transporter [Aspergillus avenaceus]|uniref:Lysosomal dipeptide transporter MFSD1 n=1 Tax=Aspergillus avenaceus TaxID=36643 RepID=A0A5N6U207_ASPAV|nr:MFS general substrate transporter [Aspergillus avenaceus]